MLQGVPTLKLYMIPNCPFVQRVLIACQVRGIEQTTLPLVEIDLNCPPKELLEINPSGSVPTLELQRGSGFHESLVITEFLDSLPAQGPRLYGLTPADIAKNKVRVEIAISQLLAPLQQAIYSKGNINAVKKAENSISKGFDWLERTLDESKGPLLGGTHLNATDVALAPFIAKLKWLFEMYPSLPKPKAGSRGENYITELLNRPEVVRSLPSEQSMKLSALKFLTPHALLQDVIDAPRSLIEAPETAIAQAGKALSHWKVEKDAKGNCLRAKFKFASHSDALEKLIWLNDAQETTDHHTSLVMHDFQSLDIILVTHEPKWGITQKDFAFALALQAYFTEGQLP